MSKRQNSHSVRAAALCCSQLARNVISPLSPLGRIARIADSNCPSRRRELHKIPLWRRDAVRLRDLRSEIDWRVGKWPIFALHHSHGGCPILAFFARVGGDAAGATLVRLHYPLWMPSAPRKTMPLTEPSLLSSGTCLLGFTSWAATPAAQGLRGGSTQRAGRSVHHYVRSGRMLCREHALSGQGNKQLPPSG